MSGNLATGSDDTGITAAAVADLTAPQSRADVRGSRCPVVRLDQTDEGVEAGHAGVAQVVGHVSQHGVDAAALAAEDAALVAGSDANLRGQKLDALVLRQAATVVHLVEIAADALNLGASSRSCDHISIHKLALALHEPSKLKP